jgi:hypothetical protein
VKKKPGYKIQMFQTSLLLNTFHVLYLSVNSIFIYSGAVVKCDRWVILITTVEQKWKESEKFSLCRPLPFTHPSSSKELKAHNSELSQEAIATL